VNDEPNVKRAQGSSLPYSKLHKSPLTLANGESSLRLVRMRLSIPNSIEDFRELRERKFEYVDKSHMISEFLDRDGHKVILLPRPRRFGKTLNLTMLKWFFEKREENLWHLFEDLHIGRAGETYKAHFQQYPIIHINFKGTKADSLEECMRLVQWQIQEVYRQHQPFLEGKLNDRDTHNFRAVYTGTCSEILYHTALQNLTRYLHEIHGKRPIVLIDEYDAPIHSGYVHGYYDKIISFCRIFYELGLKDNPHLERAVMTGILRVAKESIFSGLNNPGVYSLLRIEFNTCFGFTEPEVFTLLEKAGIPQLMDSVRTFYNGYEFGTKAVYNPWSILQFLSDEANELRSYWLNTSENALIKNLLHRHAFAVEDEIHTLLAGGTIEKYLNDNIVFRDLDQSPSMLWNILVFSGYLRAARPLPIVIGQPPPSYRLSIPNVEVAEIYRTTFQAWMDQGLKPQGGSIEALTKALLEGDIQDFEQLLQQFVAFLPSYHDVRGAKPEQFYHGLMIGLLAALEPDYEVRSNRESGAGRPDVLIKPRKAGKPGVVLELKAAGERTKRTMTEAINEGLRQIQENDYASELRAVGVQTIHSLVIAFDGKKVVVKPGDAPLVKEKRRVPRKAASSARKTAKKSAPKTKRK